MCKWTYEISTAGSEGWNKDYFDTIGLSELSENNWKKIGNIILPPGSPVGNGLSSRAANEFGLIVGTPVGTSMIDAHAGGLGLIGCRVEGVDPNFHSRVGKLSETFIYIFIF